MKDEERIIEGLEEFDIRGIEQGDESLRSSIKQEEDRDNALRPATFEDFQGQPSVVENLKVFVAAAKLRGESLDHVLLHGPPGLGKTTLSQIIANELGVQIKVTSGPVLDKPGDLAGVLTSLEPVSYTHLPRLTPLTHFPLMEVRGYALEKTIVRMMIYNLLRIMA